MHHEQPSPEARGLGAKRKGVPYQARLDVLNLNGSVRTLVSLRPSSFYCPTPSLSMFQPEENIALEQGPGTGQLNNSHIFALTV